LALALDKKTFLELVREEPSVNKRLQDVLRLRPVVSQLTCFRGLPSDQLARLSLRFEECRRRKGDRVVEQKRRGDAFFVLTSGRAVVRVMDGEGRDKIIAKLGPGDVFGEIALLKNIPRTATVEITSDSATLLKLRKKDFHTLTASIPSLSFYLNQITAERLRRLARRNPTAFHDRLLSELA
jgi:ATP-binding cassette subfamily B protein